MICIFWLYAWEEPNSCVIYFEEDARGIPWKKSCASVFVDLEKAFDRFSRKVMEWALRKKGLPKSVGPSSDEFK